MIGDDLSGEQGQVLSLLTPAPLPHTPDGGVLPAGLSPADLAVPQRRNRKQQRRKRQHVDDESGITPAQRLAHEEYGG